MSKKNSFEIWQDAVYSGRYINPVTEENMPTTPPIKAWPKVDDPITTFPKGRTQSIVFYTLAIFAVLLLGFLFITYSKDTTPHRAVQEKTEQFFEFKNYIVENVVSGVVSQLQLIIPERIVRERVKVIRVKDYSSAQTAALEQVRAWERVHMKLVNEHYNSKTLKGYRKLCIAMGDKVECNEITVRPERDAGIDLQEIH